MKQDEVITYSLSAKDCRTLWFLKRWVFFLALFFVYGLLVIDGIMLFIARNEWYLWLFIILTIVLATVQGIIWFFAKINGGIMIFGMVSAQRIDNEKIELKATQKGITYSKIINVKKVAPFHGFLLVEEKWSNYAFMPEEAAKELGIYR